MNVKLNCFSVLQVTESWASFGNKGNVHMLLCVYLHVCLYDRYVCL